MKNNPIIPIIIVCLILVTGACYTSRITLGILHPAEISLPVAINRVSVLPVAGKYSSKYDSLRFFQPKSDTIAYKVKMGYIHGIYDALSLSPRFEKVKLTSDTLANYGKRVIFYWDQLKKVCKKDTTEVVLFLTKCISYDFFHAFNELTRGDFIIEDCFLINHTEWIFYAPYLEAEVARLVFDDTAVITGGFAKTEFDDIFYDVCYSTGQKIGKRIAPYWEDADRILFSGPGKDLKDAARFVENDHWYKATLLWSQLVEDDNPSKASKAAYNIALAFEQDDELDQALLWISYADSLTETKYTKEYKAILENRILKKDKLDSQMMSRIEFIP